MENHRNFTLQAWNRLEKFPGGKWLFARLLCFRAPYFATIKPAFIALRPGFCEVAIRKRRRVLNHIGTVHAIAMCNMAELAAGVMTEATIPHTHRWIPKGMQVEYLKKAQTGLRALCKLDPLPEFAAAMDMPVTVNVLDDEDNEVFRAIITMRVSPKK